MSDAVGDVIMLEINKLNDRIDKLTEERDKYRQKYTELKMEIRALVCEESFMYGNSDRLFQKHPDKYKIIRGLL